MPERVIIADSSCLIALSNINELDILQQVYEQITITPEIVEQYLMKAKYKRMRLGKK